VRFTNEVDLQTDDKPKRDWQKTRIHFCCGVILGGLSVLATGGGPIAILIAAFLIGLLAAIFLDKFWEEFQA
jgi:energy-converting hydrogenase Eha subunit A